jgi:hypothetical protein
MHQSAKIIKTKLGLLELTKQLGSVQSVCIMARPHGKRGRTPKP